MIIEAFIRWAETAKASDRARAASALARAWLKSEMAEPERQAAEMAMVWLLDDPSPKVRLALAQVLADADDVPRTIVLSLAGDQPEVACKIIACSPVLSDKDLIDLAARGDSITRSLISARFVVSQAVCAAIAEVGDEAEISIMLDNPGAAITRSTLRRIGERMSHDCEIRQQLLDRTELPADTRHKLAIDIGHILASSDLVRNLLSGRRIESVVKESCDAAALRLADTAINADLVDYVARLRSSDKLTPALLMQALCDGHLDFLAAALAELSQLGERRVRAILLDGRLHAVRALFEAAGLKRETSEIFVETVFEWRRAELDQHGSNRRTLAEKLLSKFKGYKRMNELSGQLLDMIERAGIAEHRRVARAYASLVADAA